MSGQNSQDPHHFWVHIPCNNAWETRVEQIQRAIEEWSAELYKLILESNCLPDMVHDTGILLEFSFPAETACEEIKDLMSQAGFKELDWLMEEAEEHEIDGHCCDCSGCFHCCECKGCTENAPSPLTV